MGWETVVHKRLDLFESVWAEPVTHVATRMGISGVALAKICRKMSIPLPGRGYWARKVAGNAPGRPQLRPPKEGSPTCYVQRRYAAEPGETDLGQEIRAEVLRQAEIDPPVVVRETLADAHRLVAQSAAILLKRKRQLETVLSHHRCVDVSAHGDALERALRIMDALIRAAEGRGYTVEVTKPTPELGGQSGRIASRTLVHVGDWAVAIGIDEAIEKIPLPMPEPRKPRTPYEYIPRPKREYEYRPTGRLRLRIKNARLRGAPEVWSDRQGRKIEGSLNEFLASVAVAAERQRLDALAAEQERQAALARQRHRLAVDLQNEAADVLREDLTSRLADWHSAREIDDFMQAVRAHREPAREEATADSTVAAGSNGRRLYPTSSRRRRSMICMN